MLEELFDIHPRCDLDGMYVFTATPRYSYGQSFWFSDYRYPTAEEAMHSPDLHSSRGPSY